MLQNFCCFSAQTWFKTLADVYILGSAADNVITFSDDCVLNHCDFQIMTCLINKPSKMKLHSTAPGKITSCSSELFHRNHMFSLIDILGF